MRLNAILSILRQAQDDDIWQYLRGNKLAHRLYDSCKVIVEVCGEAWDFLIADPDTITSITARQSANVSA